MVVCNNRCSSAQTPGCSGCDGEYYFTASDHGIPAASPSGTRRASTICRRLGDGGWRKHESGANLDPQNPRINGAWYICFAGAPQRISEASGLPTHRMFVLENTDDDQLPTTGWKGQIVIPIIRFAPGATTGVVDGVRIEYGREGIPPSKQLQSVYRQDGQSVDAGQRARHADQAGIRLRNASTSRSTKDRPSCSMRTDLHHVFRLRHPGSITPWGC